MAYARNFDKSFTVDPASGLVAVGGTSPEGNLHDADLLARHVAVHQGAAVAVGATDLGPDKWSATIPVVSGQFDPGHEATAIGTELYHVQAGQNPGAFETSITFTWYAKVAIEEGTVGAKG